MTVRELKAAINTCDKVEARIDFGQNEEYYPISKKVARALVDKLPDDATADSQGVGNLATLEDGILCLW